MSYPNVVVMFDRKKRCAKTGKGKVEIVVNFSRTSRKYIAMGSCSSADLPNVQNSSAVLDKIKDCKRILDGLVALGNEVNLDNFNVYYDKEVKIHALKNPKNEYNGYDQNQSFIGFMQDSLNQSDSADGTRAHKHVVINAVKAFGKLDRLCDLTPANIMAFDKWLRHGKRTDHTIYHNYHKKVHQFIHELRMIDMIPDDPYAHLRIPCGKTKERKPLSEEELKLIREAKLPAKLDRARDLFVFCAYTGLSYCDALAFDFDSMTEKKGKIYYIDGSRIKTGADFFTPILQPAMEVLKKYDYKLPHITNQKMNLYLHDIEARLDINKSMTSHVGRHSFATMVLSHDVPIENLCRMLGHTNIVTTQIYAKILKKNIEKYGDKLDSELI